MRIAVVGVGAVGGYFGGVLAHAGEVVFITRGANLRAIRKHGLQIDDVRDKFVVNSARATDDPSSVVPVDTILLAVKAWQIERAFETLRPSTGENTLAVPLMDGVEAPHQFAEVFGTRRVAAGIALMLGLVVAPGHVRNTLPESSITLGELDGRSSDRLVRLRDAFTRADLKAKIVPDILSARWEKLILVGLWSAVGAVTRAPLGIVRSMPETRRLMEGAMREVFAVAQASGASPSENAVEWSLAWVDRDPAWPIGNLRDITIGRPSELVPEVGTVVRLGRKANRPSQSMSSFTPASCRWNAGRGEKSCFHSRRMTSPRLHEPRPL